MNIVPLNINVNNGKQIYFLSDLHLGAQSYNESFVREQYIIEFFQQIKNNTQALFLVGDVFDFWFEYNHVVPKYFVRFLACLSEFTQQQIPVYIIKGNHDLWYKDYLPKEIGVTIIDDSVELTSNNKKIFITHGDGKGKGDFKYRFLKKIFTNPICKWLFKWLHPDIGMKLALLWSRSSFDHPKEEKFNGEAKERLIQFAKEMENNNHYDYIICGHRHLPMEIAINNNNKYINLGDLIFHNSYASFDGNNLSLHYLNQND
ncbi:MAG: UDP-2,3-diacylglucosamine diphosphatase [Chitinophagales bacterium]|nr:UDP-2,3-diacylglucosamine diphosphatase [Chitinophagales bacterium]